MLPRITLESVDFRQDLFLIYISYLTKTSPVCHVQAHLRNSSFSGNETFAFHRNF